MAAVTYYMLCDSDGKIHVVSTANDFDSGITDLTVRSATFSTVAGDNPDVLREKPVTGDCYTFNDPTHTYVALDGGSTKPFLKNDGWSGNGAADPDDSVWEMTADGVNSCTLTLKKWNEFDDTAIQESGDKFGVYITGPTPCPTGTISLDANGEATISLTPTSTQKGEHDIVLRPINVSYETQRARVRFV